MLQKSIFKKRRVLRKSDISRLLNEQDQLSFRLLRKNIETGIVKEFKTKNKTMDAEILRIVLVCDMGFDESRLEIQDNEDLLIGVTNKVLFTEMKKLCPDAYILQFESNVDLQLVHLEFCKILSQMKKILEYSYVYYDDIENSKCELTKNIMQHFKTKTRVIFPIEYNCKKIARSDLSGHKIDGCYKLTYPVKNVPVSRSFFTSSSVFQKIDFQNYTFAIHYSIFYSFLSETECYMTNDFIIFD